MDKKDIQAGDDLDLLLDREVILMAGPPGGGKSYSVAMLCKDGLEQGFNVVAVDRDRGIAKAIKEIFGTKKPENLDYFLANSWEKIPKAVNHAFDILGPGDWLVFEMVGGMWDMAQSEYSRRVFGEDVADHLLTLRAEAQELVNAIGASTRSSDPKEKKEANRIISEKMAFGGMEGQTDWNVVKRMHNDAVFDRAILNGEFNILSTTSLTQIMDRDASKWPLFENIGKRPEGEKHQIHRLDTIVIAERKGGQFLWRTDLGNGKGKDRGRELYRDVDFSDVGFVESYLAIHEEE